MIYNPFYQGLGITPDVTLKSGYYDKNELMKLKGFNDWQHFVVHYSVKCNTDEKGIFYNCEKRKR